jgi:hypothetical protein
MASLTLNAYVVQETARFFHDRGLEPAVFMTESEIEFNKPEGCTEEEFDNLMEDLRLHLEDAVSKVTRA